jgi:hypothetical protein
VHDVNKTLVANGVPKSHIMRILERRVLRRIFRRRTWMEEEERESK